MITWIIERKKKRTDNMWRPWMQDDSKDAAERTARHLNGDIGDEYQYRAAKYKRTEAA